MSQFIKHGALQLSLPNGWFDASQLVAVGPEDNGFRPTLVVSIEPIAAGETVERFAARSLVGLSRLEGFALSAERAATFGTHQGLLREYTFAVQNQRVAQLQFLTLREQMGYTFTCTQRPEKMSVTRGLAEQFFASFQIEGKAPAVPIAAKSATNLSSIF